MRVGGKFVWVWIGGGGSDDDDDDDDVVVVGVDVAVKTCVGTSSQDDACG